MHNSFNIFNLRFKKYNVYILVFFGIVGKHSIYQYACTIYFCLYNKLKVDSTIIFKSVIQKLLP